MIWRSKAKRSEHRLRARIVVLSILLICVGVPVARYGPRYYSHWEQDRLTREAQSLIAAGDYQKAALSLRRTLELNPGNLQASRLFADLADKLETPEAVTLRERVSLLAPDSFDDAYALATTALKFNNMALVREALATMQKTGPNRAGFHEVAARMAMNARKPGEAQAHFAEALKLEPDNERFQLEAAVLNIQSPDAATREAARQTLEKLRGSSSQHIGALRALVATYANHGHIELALPLAKELAADPAANFEDRLVYLSVLQGAGNSDFTSYLTGLQESSKGIPLQAALLAGWMNTHNLAILGAGWLSTLPPELTRKPPIALKYAEAMILEADWKALEALTKEPGWGNFEYMRLAFLSRALAEQGNAPASDLQWQAAIALATNRPDRLSSLEKTAANWKWNERLEKLLWSLAATSNHPQEALQALAARYEKAGDTRDLYHAMSELLEHDVNNSLLKNDWAMLSLLLQADSNAAVQAAQELHEANPSNAHIAATYAFALYMTNRTDDALEVMRKLPPDQLNIPSISAYYGIILAAIRSPEAAKYLQQAKGASLLPEEEKMLEKARRDIAEKP